MIKRLSLAISIVAVGSLAWWLLARDGSPKSPGLAARSDVPAAAGGPSGDGAADGSEKAGPGVSSSSTDPWTKLLINMPQPAEVIPPKDATLVRLPGIQSGDSREQYNHDLIKMALDETVGTDGPYRIEDTEPSSGLRSFVRVLQGYIDVTWCLTTSLRESVLEPVRFDIYRGLQGYRVFLIRRGDEARFANVHSVADLRAFKGGGGSDWQTSAVLSANHLPLVTSSNYESLFVMLNHGRYDYFSRALVEPWAELDSRRELSLSVESQLLVHFPAAMYLFVHPSRPRLADRLRRGLERAVQDGRFDALIRETPEFKSMWENAHVAHRRILELENPFISATAVATGSAASFSSAELRRLMP